ncbi:MAG: hypothetical protein V3R48_01125, partial [Thermoplasmata archaeon]
PGDDEGPIRQPRNRRPFSHDSEITSDASHECLAFLLVLFLLSVIITDILVELLIKIPVTGWPRQGAFAECSRRPAFVSET